jgi:hypothetical protein
VALMLVLTFCGDAFISSTRRCRHVLFSSGKQLFCNVGLYVRKWRSVNSTMVLYQPAIKVAIQPMTMRVWRVRCDARLAADNRVHNKVPTCNYLRESRIEYCDGPIWTCMQQLPVFHASCPQLSRMYCNGVPSAAKSGGRKNFYLRRHPS